MRQAHNKHIRRHFQDCIVLDEVACRIREGCAEILCAICVGVLCAGLVFEEWGEERAEERGSEVEICWHSSVEDVGRVDVGDNKRLDRVTRMSKYKTHPPLPSVPKSFTNAFTSLAFTSAPPAPGRGKPNGKVDLAKHLPRAQAQQIRIVRADLSAPCCQQLRVEGLRGRYG